MRGPLKREAIDATDWVLKIRLDRYIGIKCHFTEVKYRCVSFQNELAMILRSNGAADGDRGFDSALLQRCVATETGSA